MRFVTEYLKYLSIAIFGFFILIYSPIIQADEINEVTVDEIILDWVNLNGKTVMISGHLFFLFDAELTFAKSPNKGSNVSSTLFDALKAEVLFPKYKIFTIIFFYIFLKVS